MLLLLLLFLWGLSPCLQDVRSFSVFDPKAALAAFFIFVIVVRPYTKTPRLWWGQPGGGSRHTLWGKGEENVCHHRRKKRGKTEGKIQTLLNILFLVPFFILVHTLVSLGKDSIGFIAFMVWLDSNACVDRDLVVSPGKAKMVEFPRNILNAG